MAVTIYAKIGADWLQESNVTDPEVLEPLQGTLDRVEWCATCGGAQPASKVCVMAQRESWESEPWGEAFGLCDTCHARYGAEELYRLMRGRYN
jgi:hypothetical protein